MMKPVLVATNLIQLQIDMQTPSKTTETCNRFKIEENKFIRSVVFLHNGKYIAIMCLLEVLIVDLSIKSTIKTIKRLSAPKNVVSISPSCMCILYSDNYCMMYDTEDFQAIYTMIGIPNDHKGIKVSGDGRFLLYGNDTAIQVWNVGKCCIEMLSHKYKYVSCYNINRDGNELYLGTFNGEIVVVKLIVIKELANSKVPFGKELKPNSKCLLGVQVVDSDKLVAVDISLSCYLINIATKEFIALCKFQPIGMLTKPLTFLYSPYSKSTYVHANEHCYRVGVEGDTQVLGNSKDVGLARMEDWKKVVLLKFEDNTTFVLKQV